MKTRALFVNTGSCVYDKTAYVHVYYKHVLFLLTSLPNDLAVRPSRLVHLIKGTKSRRLHELTQAIGVFYIHTEN